MSEERESYQAGGEGDEQPATWLQEAQARCDAATGGVWSYWQDSDWDTWIVETDIQPLWVARCWSRGDAVFIAASHTDLPRALERIAALEAQLGSDKEWLDSETRWANKYFVEARRLEKRIEELEGQLGDGFRYEGPSPKLKGYIQNLEAENGELRQQLGEARHALVRYGEHATFCKAVSDAGRQACTCGLTLVAYGQIEAIVALAAIAPQPQEEDNANG